VDAATGSRRIFGVSQDITERRRLEERLLEKHKLEAVGRLAAGLAHRLNNSLTEVLGNIGFALDTLGQRSPAREPLDTAAHACTTMAGLTRDLLAYAGRSMSFMERIDLSRLVAAKSLAQLVSPPVRLELELEQGVPPVEGDADQLERMAAHLVANAVESIPEGGPGAVTIAVGARDLNACDLAGFLGRENLKPGTYVCLRVTDSGCGMDAATVSLAFDPFFSTKFVGRGLGLAAVLGVVRNHRGGIRVESEPGKGTSVTVCIPARVQ
jgi:signal transduction histidine kinase